MIHSRPNKNEFLIKFISILFSMSEEEKMLKVLSSETRRNMIKELSNGYRNPSDLSKILKKSKSTVVEHLKKLEDAGLVSKSSKDGRKWVFYSLTKKGESLVPQRSNRIVLVLTLMFITFAAGVFSLYNYYNKPLIFHELTFYEGDTIMKRIAPAASTEDAAQAYDEINVIESRNRVYLMLSVVMFMVFAVIFATFISMRKTKT
jgi:DNA-binding transcriptional ArsR family regulator